MAGTSAASFEFVKRVQTVGCCDDWSEFAQSAYVQEALHDGLPRPAYAQGVCAALCAYVLSRWLTPAGTGKQPVDQLVLDCDSTAVARPSLPGVMALVERLYDQADPQRALDRFQECVAEATVPHRHPRQSDMVVRRADAVERSRDFGPSLLAIAGITTDGHAVLCDATRNALFDPNLGYYQARDAQSYGVLFGMLLDTYPAWDRSAFRFLAY